MRLSKYNNYLNKYAKKQIEEDPSLEELRKKVNKNTEDITKNKQEIDKIKQEQITQNEQINQNTTSIGNINNDILEIKREQITQNNDILNNKNKNNAQDAQITANTEKINKLIEALKQSTIIQYKGQWNATTTYKMGEVVSHQEKLYLCKTQTSLNEAPDTHKNIWDLLSSPEMNLDGYVTDEELKNALKDLENKIQDLLNKYNELNGKFANYVDKTSDQDINGNKTFAKPIKYSQPITFNNDEMIPNLKEVKRISSENSTSAAQWGKITGNINSQNDLMAKLNEKANITDLAKKQDKLTAGQNIKIEGNTISATTGSNAQWGQITGTITNQNDLMTKLNEKVDLTSTQTITGQKTFGNNLIASDPRIGQISNSSNSTTIGINNQTFYKPFAYSSDFSSSFGDNSLITKKYVDDKVKNSSGGSSGIPGKTGTTQIGYNSLDLTQKNDQGATLISSFSKNIEPGKLYLARWNIWDGGGVWDTYGSFIFTLPTGYNFEWRETILKGTSDSNGNYVYEIELSISKNRADYVRYDNHKKNPRMSLYIWELN